MLTAASSPSAGCGAVCVQVLGGRPPVDQVHVAASLCVCDMCVDLLEAAWGVALCRLVVSCTRVYRGFWLR